MEEPPPCDESVGNISRIYQRRNIINELDMIKTRVDQVASYRMAMHIMYLVALF